MSQEVEAIKQQEVQGGDQLEASKTLRAQHSGRHSFSGVLV